MIDIGSRINNNPDSRIKDIVEEKEEKFFGSDNYWCTIKTPAKDFRGLGKTANEAKGDAIGDWQKYFEDGNEDEDINDNSLSYDELVINLAKMLKLNQQLLNVNKDKDELLKSQRETLDGAMEIVDIYHPLIPVNKIVEALNKKNYMIDISWNDEGDAKLTIKKDLKHYYSVKCYTLERAKTSAWRIFFTRYFKPEEIKINTLEKINNYNRSYGRCSAFLDTDNEIGFQMCQITEESTILNVIESIAQFESALEKFITLDFDD